MQHFYLFIMFKTQNFSYCLLWRTSFICAGNLMRFLLGFMIALHLSEILCSWVPYIFVLDVIASFSFCFLFLHDKGLGFFGPLGFRFGRSASFLINPSFCFREAIFITASWGKTLFAFLCTHFLDASDGASSTGAALWRYNKHRPGTFRRLPCKARSWLATI